ncbi:heavy-metal-associated domain-containing protein [Psychroflexus tropicus]|uniref:heavy-metal-associated domain-containing protein n=1 Tax=Psychroflexus tropicus TaxID=197345 RepID=UPI000362606E|nr:heavy metal-associated domain-containing protein [Psychroflexus tropicus]
METKVIVQNLKCGGCAHTISKQINAMGKVENVVVEPEDSSVSFTYYDEAELLLVKDKLKQLGYPVAGEANSYLNKAKSFVSCATGKMNS